MEKIAFIMTLLPGHEEEYKQRHDDIWPEVVEALKQAGVSDYSIFHDPTTNKLFAVLKRDPQHTMNTLPLNPVVKKWWDYMADIMETNTDNSPVVNDINQVFHLD